MERSDVPYLLLGAAAAAQRQTSAAVGVASRATELAIAPAAFAWRSLPASPLRRRASDVSFTLTEDGHRTLTQGRVVAGAAISRLSAEIGESRIVEEVVDRVLTAGVIERLVTAILNHPATASLVDGVLDDPAVERLVAAIMDSPLLEDLTSRVLESNEMQMVLGHITRSPELRAALAQQTAGLAGDMAVSVRSRTVVADDRAERLARGLLRRKQRPRVQ